MRNIGSILLLLLFISCTSVKDVNENWLSENYTKREVNIPMRDGIHLYSAVYEPVGESQRPILIIRTPYSCAPYGNGWSWDLTSHMQQFLLNKYILVFQDVRGRYMSEGEFINVRPYNPNKSIGQTDEASDTYDTIEWLLDNTDNNGAVGVTGMSYPGFYALQAALSGHPALKAVSPQAPILDWFKGDDVHHNGALMLMDIYGFSTYMFKEHNNPISEDHGLPSPVGSDAYKWYLERNTIAQLTNSLPDTLDFWNEVLDHPNYDEYWHSRSVESHLHDIKPAILVVGGSFDTDDCYGALNTYKLIKKNSPETDLHFVYGPWCHGCWHNSDYDGLGSVKMGVGISDYFMKYIEYPFFSYYLEGKGERPEHAYVYCSGSEAWTIKNDDLFENVDFTPIYFAGNGALSLTYPKSGEPFSTYLSDPSNPVPYYKDSSRKYSEYMVGDQRFASEREDVLTFIGKVFDADVHLEGPIKVHLELESSSDDFDVIVKLIDVYPDGYQMLVRGDVFPVRYRYSLSSPKPVTPGEIFTLDFTLNDVIHTIKPGHKIMVQVQSTWFPLVNRNPQKFMDNIYLAQPDDYTVAQIKLHHSADNASRISLPIISNP